MKVLITGAKGFVGRNLVTSLENIDTDKNFLSLFTAINKLAEKV